MKYYRAIKTIGLDGTTMDKLIYAAPKGLRVVDVSTLLFYQE